MVLLIPGILILLAAVVLYRTFRLKPTFDPATVIPLDNTPRAAAYGEKLAKMIRCETISGRDQDNVEKFRAFHRVLEELFPHVHDRCERIDLDGSLLYKWAGKRNADPIILMSHQDVVEAGGKWAHPPFSGHIDEEGRVWGRGTVDTKGSLFCIFTALEELIASGYEPEGDVYIASSRTEEFSGPGAPATVRWLRDHGVRPALVLDEGGMILEAPIAGAHGIYAMVGTVEKGYADVKFIARANGGHASAPTKDTALVRLGKFMARVDSRSPFKAQLTPTVTEMFTRLAPNMDFPLRLVMANLWLFRPVLARVLPMINASAGAMTRTTIAFTTAKGSDGLNVLPQTAYVTGNMRIIHHQPNEASIGLISRLAAQYGLDTEIIYQDTPCPVVAHDSKQFRLIESVTNQVYPGVIVSPYTMTGGTDAKFYKEICDNCIRFAPLYINKQQYGSIHALDENIHQAALPHGVDFYKQVIMRTKELN